MPKIPKGIGGVVGAGLQKAGSVARTLQQEDEERAYGVQLRKDRLAAEAYRKDYGDEVDSASGKRIAQLDAAIARLDKMKSLSGYPTGNKRDLGGGDRMEGESVDDTGGGYDQNGKPRTIAGKMTYSDGEKVIAPGEDDPARVKNDSLGRSPQLSQADIEGDASPGSADGPEVGGPFSEAVGSILRSLGKTRGAPEELIDAVRGTDPAAGKALEQARAPEAFRDHKEITSKQLGDYILQSDARVYGPGRPDDLGFITSAERALANLPKKFAEAKELTADQWQSAMNAGGARKEAFTHQIEPALKALQEQGVTGKITRDQLVEAMARSRQTLRSVREGKTRKGEVYVGPDELEDPAVLARRAGRIETDYSAYVAPGKSSNYQQELFVAPGIDYRSHNWATQGVIGHIRTTERRAANGEKVLHVEELQSDLHQEGAKYGYKGSTPVVDVYKVRTDAVAAAHRYEEWRAKNPAGDRAPKINDYGNWEAKQPDVLNRFNDSTGLELWRNAQAAFERLASAESTRRDQSFHQPPRAPLENWEEPFVKRVLYRAAQEGYDTVTFPSWASLHGALQNEGTKAFYDQRLPATIKRVAKSLGLAPEQVQIRMPLDNMRAEQIRGGWGVDKPSGGIEYFDTKAQADAWIKSQRSGKPDASLLAIRLTPAAKEQLAKGIASYAVPLLGAGAAGGLILSPEEAQAQQAGSQEPVVQAGFEDVERQKLTEILNGLKFDDGEAEGASATPPKDGEDIKEVQPGVWGKLESMRQDVSKMRSGSPNILKAAGRGVRNAAVNLPENMAISSNDLLTSQITRQYADPDDPFVKLLASVIPGGEAAREETRKQIQGWKDQHDKTEAEVLKLGEGLDAFAKDKTQFLETENPGLIENLVEGITQFTAGFMLSRKIGGGKDPTTILGKMASGALHGTGAEYLSSDPVQQTLIGTIAEFVPEAKGPLTDFFTVKPDDKAAVARLKRALEGMGLGVALDSIVLPIAKAVRSAAHSDTAAEELVRGMEPEQRQQLFERAVEQKKIEGVQNGLNQLGDPGRDIIEITPTPPPTVESLGAQDRGARRMARSAAETERAGLTGEDAAQAFGQESVAKADNKLTINFARIDAPEDIENVIGQMSDAMKPQIDAARRGVQTFEATRLDADELNAWDVLAKRRPNEPLNAEQSVAVRELWVSSGRKLREVSMAAAADPNPGNIAAARRMLAVYQAVQSEVISARTETARALSSWRMPVTGAGAGDLKALDSMIGQAGGEVANAEFFKRLATADAKTMSAVAERGAFARTADALYAAWINGLLSGPKSHVTNALSGFQMLFLGPLERAAAGTIRALTGGEGAQAREALSQLAAIPDGFREAWVYAQRTAKMSAESVGARLDNVAMNSAKDEATRAQFAGQVNAREAEVKRLNEERQAVNPAAFSSAGKFSSESIDSLSARAFGINPASAMGVAMDALTWGVKWPGKAMQFADELFKVVNYRMEVNAQAMRMAQDAIAEGTLQPHEAKQFMGEIISNPPDDIKLKGADYAMYQTFTTPPTEGVKSLQRLLGKLPAARLFAPFVNTPANIFRYSLERTPVAPFMRHVRDEMKAGGSRRDMAIARMALGNLALFSFISIAASGAITGKGPTKIGERQAWARTGAKPYSAKIGDKWVTYSRADPMGFHIGLAADIVEIARALGDDDDPSSDADIGEIIAIATGSIAQNILNKSFMSGTADVFEWASDPVRYGEQKAEGMGASVIPAWMAETRRQMDPTQREVGSFIDAFRNRIPGLSATLPARRDMWGREMTYASGLGNVYDTLSPLYVSKESAEPIDKEMTRLGLFVGMPPKDLTYDGVPIKLKNRPEAWSRYLQLSGNELKLPQYNNMGAKDWLNATIQGESYYSPVYKIFGPERRQKYIRNVVEDYRDAAKERLLLEFPDISENVSTGKAQKRAADMDALSQGTIP